MQEPGRRSVASIGRQALHGEHHLVVLLIAIAVVVGAVTVRDYGVSWDEPPNYRYTDYALHAYAFILRPGQLAPFNANPDPYGPVYDNNLNLYGPAYSMAADLIATALTALIPVWSAVNAWHFAYFLTFLAGALALYLLSRRWMSELSAASVTLLFIAQPLLWGHAFINPRDIPFMACFTAAVYSGLKMTDQFKKSLTPGASLVAAAVLLGFTISLRVIGPLAGVIVLGYAVQKLGWKSVGVAALYIGLAAAFVYLTWPYLWSAPVAHYLKSVETLTRLPYEGDILFGGRLYDATKLPWTYFPTFLGIQLTEPALLLSVLGGVLSVRLLAKKEISGPVGLFLAWFLAPAALIIGSGAQLYDNARHLYFLLPPIFMLAGIALERLFALLRHPAAEAALLLAAILPGILPGIQLHPYEYVYYNSLVGGTGGAYRNFETDYWGISYKEITEDLNRTAREGSNILVFGPIGIVETYARPDLHVYYPTGERLAPYNYAVMLTRDNLDEQRCKGAKIVETVERQGAMLSVVKKITGFLGCR